MNMLGRKADIKCTVRDREVDIQIDYRTRMVRIVTGEFDNSYPLSQFERFDGSAEQFAEHKLFKSNPFGKRIKARFLR